MAVHQYSRIFIMIFVCLCLTACSTSKSNDATKENNGQKDHLVLAIASEPSDGFDPTTGWGRYGSPLFQSTLLTLDQDFNVQYDLAKDLKISEDGMKWTVQIRDDVKFSDGKMLTAKDIMFTFETAKNSHSVVDLQNLKKIEVLDPYTVQFTLEKPQSTFLYMLTMLGIVPEHAYSKNYNENPIGSGPYQLIQWDKGQQLIVEQNPYYYGKKSLFKKLTFLFLSEDSAYLAAKAGQVDIVAVPPNLAKEAIPGMKRITLDSVDNRGVMLPFVKPGIDSEKGIKIGHEVTSDVAIRKAMNVAINREQLVEDVLEGFGTPAFSVADQLPWWNEETVFEDGNIEEAEKILVDGGWTKNADGIFEKDGVEARFTLVYPANDQTRQSLAIAFKQMVKQIGIDVKTEGKSWNDIQEIMYTTPVVMGWGSQDPIEMYHLYHSKYRGTGYSNANYYENKKVDAYMEKAIMSKTQEEANQYWKKAQWDKDTGFSSLGDAPWVWLVNLQHVYFVNEHLNIGEQKIQPHGHGWPITEFICDWTWEE